MANIVIMKCHTCKGLYDVADDVDKCPNCGGLRVNTFYYTNLGNKVDVLDRRDLPKEKECVNIDDFEMILKATQRVFANSLNVGSLNGDVIVTSQGETVMRWYVNNKVVIIN